MSKSLNPQPGDIVHVRARVIEIKECGRILATVEIEEETDSPNCRFCSFKTEILAIEPRPLKVGDMVTHSKFSRPLEIRAIDSDGVNVWVLQKEEPSYRTTVALNDLRPFTKDQE